MASDKDKTEAELFREAMRDAKPLRTPQRNEHRDKPAPRPRFSKADDQAALQASRQPTPDEIEQLSGDFITFAVPGLNKRQLRKLRQGQIRLEAEIDLHGLTADKAESELKQFLAEARHEGLRCVRVVHGKGRRSGIHGPVLKQRVADLLLRRNDILAFTSAQPADGGTGALYVLLAANPS